MARNAKAKTHFLESTDLKAVIDPPKPAQESWGTKVIATIGPACRDVETLAKMLKAGMACARVDLTGGSLQYHQGSLRNLATAVKQEKKLCAVMLDTTGRELLIRRKFTLNDQGWPQHEDPTEVQTGQELVLNADPNADISDPSQLAVTYSGFADMCQPGDQLFIGRYLVNGADQSSLYLEVKEVSPPLVTCVAQNDAVLDGLLTLIHQDRADEYGRMSNTQASMPVLTESDISAIKAISKEFEIDFIALSCTCSGADIVSLRDFLNDLELDAAKIVAKVENRQGLDNFSGIVAAADAIILSRGNLGLDVPSEKMALVQKVAIDSCNQIGRPVSITRVMDTMVSAPRCTRAEATDVANAVLDGVDGILLGAETLRGSYPVQTIQTVLSICRSAEEVFDSRQHFENLMSFAMVEDEDELMEHPTGQSPQAVSEMDQGLGVPARLDTAAAAAAAVAERDSKPSSRDNSMRGGVLRTISDRSTSEGLPPLGPGAASPRGNRRSSFEEPDTPRSGAGDRVASMPKPPSFGSIPKTMSTQSMAMGRPGSAPARGIPRLTKQEAMASTAVRAAAKLRAGLIIVYASSGRTASLIAKYRPSIPILTLVVPQLTSNTLSWTMTGRSLARQCLIIRGLSPMLAAPMQGRTDAMLSQAVAVAVQRGLVEPHQHVVCVESVKEVLTLKVVAVDALGRGMRRGGEGSHHQGAAPNFRNDTNTRMMPTFSGELPAHVLANGHSEGLNKPGALNTLTQRASERQDSFPYTAKVW
ncbi:hypothetical protein WJX73_008258 [Symbiochloris irregularis]|uniref:Pyruvate kinase n=1 Tax=Symbiochloris irregularis TaxID=706552 RepID=A0AAW1P648_9CHLO